MTIKYYIKENYGTAHQYFADEKMSRAWREMTGRKTFTLNDMDMLKRFIGQAEFEQVVQPKK